LTFKKDYINYLLHTVVNQRNSGFEDNYRLKKLVDSIVAVDDVMKVTYLIGKTAGLELLFKYLLYLKDNFEYDKTNLKKICMAISEYTSQNDQEEIKKIEEPDENAEQPDEKQPISIEAGEGSADNLISIEDAEQFAEEETEDSADGKLTLIENVESYTGEAEVFELESISDSVENSDKPAEEGPELIINRKDDSDEEIPEEELSETEQSEESTEEIETEIADTGSANASYIEDAENVEETKKELKEPEFEIEIEVRKPIGSSQEETHVKEEAVTDEAYYNFETRFFEDVKILEKLLATVDKDCRTGGPGKPGERCLQCMSEIIGITSELSNLSRQLSFDLIADIFFTMNIYFTRSLSHPDILTSERIKLLDSSLALVNSLIKGEDYLNYDTIVEKIEKLKQEISPTQEKEFTEEIAREAQDSELSKSDSETIKDVFAESENAEIEESYETQTPAVAESGSKGTYVSAEFRAIEEEPAIKQSQMESAIFKLKYLVKEFEKSFTAIKGFRGEYGKFDALEKIRELNNALRLIAKISAAIKMNDVLKLAEVTYVFLKYVKDYRMDLREAEIQQIVKYIIFTFKMLLTNRKPEDFNVLVQHLNNPVKIFADS
jgi:hypothetical protein